MSGVSGRAPKRRIMDSGWLYFRTVTTAFASQRFLSLLGRDQVTPLRRRALQSIWLFARIGAVLGVGYAVDRGLLALAKLLARAGSPWSHSTFMAIASTGLLLAPIAKALICLILCGREIRVLFRYLGSPRGLFRSVLLVLICLVATLILRAALCCAVAGLLDVRFPPEVGSSVCVVSDHSMSDWGFQALARAAYRFVAAPIWESLVFTGAVFFLFLRLFGKWPAVLLTGVAWAGAHGVGSDAFKFCFGFLGHVLVGAVHCFILIKTHRLRWPILFHSLWNVQAAFFTVVWPSIGIII